MDYYSNCVEFKKLLKKYKLLYINIAKFVYLRYYLNMRTIYRKVSQSLYVLFTILMMSVSLLSLDNDFTVPIIAVVSSLVLFAVYQFKDRIIPSINKLLNNKACFFVIFSVGIALRFLPFLLNATYLCENNLSDTGVHFFAAQQLAEGYLESHIIGYEKVYPYLFPYSCYLGLFQKMFHNINLAIVVSNTIIDICGGYALYQFLNKTCPGAITTGILLWVLNPFSIVMCWLPLNIVLVNTLVIIILLVGCLLLNDDSKFIFWAALFGLLVYTFNLFRPVFTVFLIAIVLVILLSDKYDLKKKLICCFVMVLFMSIPTLITRKLISSVFHDDLLGQSGGWSFYVGANYETKGQWSREDSNHFFGDVLPKYETISEAQVAIKEEGIQRYKDMTIAQLINHLGNKLSVLFANIGTSVYDIRFVFGIGENDWKYKAITTVVGIFFSVLSITTIYYCLTHIKDNNSINLYVFLSFMGLVAAFLIVEVMNRYSSVFFTFLIPVTSIGLMQISKE